MWTFLLGLAMKYLGEFLLVYWFFSMINHFLRGCISKRRQTVLENYQPDFTASLLRTDDDLPVLTDFANAGVQLNLGSINQALVDQLAPYRADSAVVYAMLNTMCTSLMHLRFSTRRLDTFSRDLARCRAFTSFLPVVLEGVGTVLAGFAPMPDRFEVGKKGILAAHRKRMLTATRFQGCILRIDQALIETFTLHMAQTYVTHTLRPVLDTVGELERELAAIEDLIQKAAIRIERARSTVM